MSVSPTKAPCWDIFFSHRTARYSEVKPLVDALKNAGLKIWIDREGVRPFESIDNRIKDGLALCRLLVAYYTPDYGRSRACQWELTSAYIAGEQEGDATRRIAVIRGSPTDGVDYLLPIALKSAKFFDLPDPSDVEATAACVGAVRERCAELSSVIGDIVSATPAPWYPQSCSPVLFPRFVGRIQDLWRLHSALHLSDYPLVTGENGPGVACITGLGGVGKSMLAEEYGKRFFARYPGGVIWLSAGGEDAESHTDLPLLEARREAAFADVARQMGIPFDKEDAGQVASLVWNHLRHSGKQHLVVVDNLPPRLPPNQVRCWIGPTDLATTIITTWGQHYGGVARQVPLDVLESEDAYRLLTTRRAPANGAEVEAAESAAANLGAWRWPSMSWAPGSNMLQCPILTRASSRDFANPVRKN